MLAIKSAESVWPYLSTQSPEGNAVGNSCMHSETVATAGPNAVLSVIWHPHNRDGPSNCHYALNSQMLATPIKVRQEVSKAPWNFLCSGVGYSWQLHLSEVRNAEGTPQPKLPGAVWHHPIASNATDSTVTDLYLLHSAYLCVRPHTRMATRNVLYFKLCRGF